MSARRMMFVPFNRGRPGSHLFDLVRPKWIRDSLRATGWNPKLVGYGLLVLLLADLALAVAVFPHLPNK